MELRIHPDQLLMLASALARNGSREIGGVLVGEHVAPNIFRLVDLSVQEHGGTAACFVRRPEHHKPFLDDFFLRTGKNYERFNYLGEWHSHPSFPAVPSHVDV